MANSFVAFVEDLVYGTGLSPNPNHRDWLALGLTSGTEWLTHYLDRMLATYESWVATEGLPPVTPWDGYQPLPWNPATTVAFGPELDGSYTGVADLDDLGVALRSRYTNVALQAQEINGTLKAPFSYRFWGYLKWAWTMREKFLGRQVLPTGVVLDRDGTILSAIEFLNTFNDTHRSWHGAGGAAVSPTPYFESTAGQRVARGIFGAGQSGYDFMRFHRENMEIFHRWYARTGQPAVIPIDMGRPGGWPPTSGAVVNPPNPWVPDEASVTTPSPFASNTTPNQIGIAMEPSYHVSGHTQNTDIGPLSHNNYVPRFHNWHGWIDSQWWWREPRFARSDPTTGERTRIFRPAQFDGTDFPGLQHVSIVRDPLLAADTIHPANAVSGIDFATGAGTIRMKLYVRDPFARDLRMRLVADVLDSTEAVVSTVTVLRDIGPTGDHPFDTEFTEDIALAGAFTSDDPGRANPAVGFVNSRIRITGSLWVPNPAAPDDSTQSPDPDFVHEDVTYIDLVREKQAPEVLIYQNVSTFSEDQVNSNLSGAESRFDNAFYVVTQDRTALGYNEPAWPAELANEVKGLVLGLVPASGQFDDIGHAPEVVLWQDTVDAAINGVSVELQGAPSKEDASLQPEITQRLTWTYRVIFQSVNDAFAGVPVGGSQNGRIRVTARDRAGNASTVEASVKFLRAANPYMIDGDTPWLSVDTRVFTALENQTRFNETMTAGRDPLEFLSSIVARLNNGTSGAETFDSISSDALDYAESIPNPSTGSSTSIFNFALAKVRLQGSNGASGVRIFFRAFRYSAPSLLFDTTKGYRSFDNGTGTVIPVLGFESQVNGAAILSVPFFASPRLDPAASSLETQTDPPNVLNFPAGNQSEQILYCGAWLDFNQPSVRYPSTYSNATPNGNGPYPAVSMQSLRTLMDDFHQCIVTEIRYDDDPTESLAAPANDDNLAQRNLTILSSDNPGDPITRTIEHSFEIDLVRPRLHGKDRGNFAAHAGEDHGHGPGGPAPCPNCGHEELDSDHCCACCGNMGEHGPFEYGVPRGAISTFDFADHVLEEAMNIAMLTPGGMKLMLEEGHHAVVHKFGQQAAERVRRSFPVVLHPSRWQQTARVMDELMFVWNNLPPQSVVHLFLPGMNAEEIATLRNARHAPATVVAQGGSMLRLTVGGVSYVPIPPAKANRQPAMITIELPEGVKAGQTFTVDIIQLRAGASVANGAFRVEIPIRKAAQIVAAVQRGVGLLFDRLSLMTAKDRRRPILERRLETERRRAAALSTRAGVPWNDPTVWTDPDGHTHPITGMKLRVFLEKILIVDDSDPWLLGKGEFDFTVRVRSNDNGGVEQATRLPAKGHYKVGSGQMININRVVFEGFADQHLAIRIQALERDLLHDDNLGVYNRVFTCGAATWIGEYGPYDERLDPEDLGPWKVWYRIERA